MNRTWEEEAAFTRQMIKLCNQDKLLNTKQAAQEEQTTKTLETFIGRLYGGKVTIKVEFDGKWLS